MIIFKPCCGLGNQMYIYAVAKSLALRHQAELFVDKSYYSEQNQAKLPEGAGRRAYELDLFDLDLKEMDGYENRVIRRVRSRNLHKKMRAILPCLLWNSISSHKHLIHFVEKKPWFDKTVLRLPDNVILEGFFACYKYFDRFEDVIRKDLAFKTPPDAINAKLLSDIVAADSVSVHIRRGDYVTNRIVTQRFGLCSLDFYRRGAEYVAEKVRSPVFFVFSDDPQWAVDHLKTGYPTVYVTHNTQEKGYEDLRLMSACRHNIIANSTFSWWAAWLNKNPDKIVVCPTPAFEELEIRESDFYPKEWKKLPR